MTDRPSLGELYAREVEPPAPIFPEMIGSIGAQYTDWIAVDLDERERLAYDAPPAPAKPLPPIEDPTEFVPTRKAVRELKEVHETRPTPTLPPQPGKLGEAWKGQPGVGTELPRPEATPAPTQAPVPADTGDRRPATLARSSALMASGTLVSRVLGMLRAALTVAAIGGTTVSAANVWSTANTLPNVIYLLLAGGVINAVLVPQITKSLRHADGGKAYTDRLLTLALSLLIVVTALFMIAAPLMYRMYDVKASGERLELGATFALICLPQILFYGMYALFGQVLNARGRFGAFMWAPALANVIGIAGLVAFLLLKPAEAPISEWDGSMILLLAGSATLGIAAQALVLLWPLWRDGYRFTPNFGWRGVGLGSASKVARWAFAAVILQQLGLLLTTNVLNTQPGGEPGKLAQENGFLLFMLPHSLVTVSLVTALFTRMSRAANVNNHALVRSDLREGLRLTAVATVPCTVGAFVLGFPLIGALFGTGEEWAIGSFMIAMMLGLAPFGLCVLVQRVFYAYEDAKTPFYMQLICTGIAAVITLGCLFIPNHYVGIGIGLSLTISNLVQGLIGLKWLEKKVGRIPMNDVTRTYVRLLAASIMAGVAALIVRLAVGFVLNGRLDAIVTLIVGGIAFLVVYVWAARRMHIPEIDNLVRPISAKLRRLARR